jgi:hypothetical protein
MAAVDGDDMMRRITRSLLMAIAAVVASAAASAQSPSRPVAARVSVHVDSATRTATDGARSNDASVSTAVTFESIETDGNRGVDFRLDMRHLKAVSGLRPDRTSFYDAYAGAHFGGSMQVRLRAGHMWLQDLGTIGALAGGLLEVGQPRSKEGIRVRAGIFTGREPRLYEIGYVPDVRKTGGYAALESGALRRHVVGYTRVQQGTLTERSVLSITNYVPAGSRFFAYQAAEVDVTGPADGVAPSGVSYFLTNARYSPTQRIELSGTYNRGRSIDARTLTNDLLNGRALTQQATDGLRYESRGGRLTVELFRGTQVYGSYAQDRTNRDDALTGRVAIGGHAANVLRSGFDISASDSRINRPSGAYHSRYVSVGRNIGRALYVSGDYSTSLSVIQFLRSDGIVIETRPWTRRFSGSANATLGRSLSMLFTIDYTQDEAQNELRVLSGLSYRFR